MLLLCASFKRLFTCIYERAKSNANMLLSFVDKRHVLQLFKKENSRVCFVLVASFYMLGLFRKYHGFVAASSSDFSPMEL